MATSPAHRLGRQSSSRATWIAGTAAAGTLLAACASQATHPGAVPAAAPDSISATASQSYVVYPALGTAAIERYPSCQFAKDTAIPVAKRSGYATECDQFLRYATDPVTKPVMPARPTSLTPTATEPPVPDCVASQLRARFGGGGYATGNDFGVIVIWNPGPEPCQLHGQDGFAGYYPDGSRDANAHMEQPITSRVITLQGNMPAPRDGRDQSDYLVAFIMGLERDDATQPDALCRPQDEGTPAVLVLSVGTVTVTVTNADAGSLQSASIYGCHGRVVLEELRGPQQG